MKTFENYARHYNALYEDKDYLGEANYVGGIVRHHLPKAASLLDIGCGTGRHALAFSEAGFDVTGIDRSPTMLEEARRIADASANAKKVRFLEADVRDFELGARFDAVVAMFHVVSYLTTNSDVLAALTTVRRHLAPGGLFIFDFWYGPGVLTDRPIQRLKTIKTGSVEVMRYATPQMNVNDNVVSIDYALVVLDKETGRYDRFDERHQMRYYFRPDIEFMLETAGFRVAAFTKWMSDELPDDRAWNAVVTAVAR